MTPSDRISEDARTPPKHGWMPVGADPVTMKFWEIRHQLDINCQIIRGAHPEAAPKEIGHTIDIVTQHVYDRLNELEAALASSSKQEAGVRELQWGRDHIRHEWHGNVVPGTGYNYLVKDDGRWCVDDPLRRWVLDQSGDVEAAKAAAQADYDTRIRAALEPSNLQNLQNAPDGDLLHDIFDFLGGVDGASELRDRIRRALEPSNLHNLQNTPDGYVLVPVEPTEAMKRAAMDVLMYQGDIYARDDGTIVVETVTPGDLWQAMLAALREKP